MLHRCFLPLVLLTASTFLPAQTQLHVPLSFEQNQGQSAQQVRYLAHGGPFTLFLTDSGPIVSFAKKNSEPSAIQLHWLNAQPSKAVAEARQSGVANYLIGRDPQQWHTNVPTFARVRYAQVYPGIDVLFHGTNHDLEYDVVVQPGADPAAVAFRIDGATAHLDREGNLVLHTENGDLQQHRPVIYQEVNGTRIPIEGGYQLADGRVSFRLGPYDRTRELVIDPTLTYSTYFGGRQQEWGWSIAVDGTNHAYVYGNTYSTNFPIKNAYQSTKRGGSGSSIFIAKFESTGGGLIYSTYFGGSCNPAGIAVDRYNAVYFDASCDPKLTPGKILGSPDMTYAQAVIAKLNPSGTSLAYSLIFGGQNGAYPAGIALDSTQHAYLTGATDSVDFPTTSGAYQTSYGSGGNAFVVKVAANGSGFNYSTYFPHAAPNSIAVDPNGNAYISGSTAGGLPTTASAFQRTKPAYTPCDPGDPCDSTSDLFVTKFNATGSALVYSTYLGGKNEDDGYGLTVDANGNAYVTGQTYSTNFPTTSGAMRRTLPCCYVFSAFVTKLNSTGSALSYSTYLGGSGGSSGASIAVNSQGQAFVTGNAGANFPVKNAIQSTMHGIVDAFITRMWATGGGVIWSTYLGGSNVDYGKAVRLDGAGNPYVTGWTSSTEFPTTSGAYRPHNQGSQDVFLVKITN